MISQGDVSIEYDKSKPFWFKATHVPTGTVVEGTFKSGKELLAEMDKAIAAQQNARR